jgi:hypothetical protein
VLDKLHAKQTSLAITAKKLLIERKQLAHASHVDESEQATKDLTTVCRRLAQTEHLQQSLVDAIRETKERILAAQERDTREQRAAVAREDLSKISELETLAKRIDQSLEGAAAGCHGISYDARRHSSAKQFKSAHKCSC